MNTSAILIQLVNESLEKFKAIPETVWSAKSDPKKWSKKEILGHLTDSAVTNLRRFLVTQFEQNKKIIYLQDEWVLAQNYQQTGTQDIIELWKALNLHIARTVENIPSEKLSNTCDTGKGTIELHSLQFLISDYINHMEHHLEQLK